MKPLSFLSILFALLVTSDTHAGGAAIVLEGMPLLDFANTGFFKGFVTPLKDLKDIASVVVSSTGDYLYAVDRTGKTFSKSLVNGQPTKMILPGGNGSGNYSIALSPDNQTLVISNDDYSHQSEDYSLSSVVVDLSSNNPPLRIDQTQSGVFFSKDSKWVAIPKLQNRGYFLFNTVQKTISSVDSTRLFTGTFSPDSKTFIFLAEQAISYQLGNPVLQTINLEGTDLSHSQYSQLLIKDFKSYSIGAFSISSDSKWAAIGNGDQVAIVDLGNMTYKLIPKLNKITSADFSKTAPGLLILADQWASLFQLTVSSPDVLVMINDARYQWILNSPDGQSIFGRRTENFSAKTWEIYLPSLKKTLDLNFSAILTAKYGFTNNGERFLIMSDKLLSVTEIPSGDNCLFSLKAMSADQSYDRFDTYSTSENGHTTVALTTSGALFLLEIF